jgi:hypothetical protein
MFSHNAGEVINVSRKTRNKYNSENSNPNLDKNGFNPNGKKNGSQNV